MGKKVMFLPEIDYLVSLQTFCMGKDEEEEDKEIGSCDGRRFRGLGGLLD
ncbi:MAG: hypothetical protein U9N62_09520 [Thermotogota bacterium]|nr:hypothetical protein [Thermotogota bacterium]